MSESDGVYQLNDAQLAKAWLTCAKTAERQRDTARRWANAWKAAAKDMRTLVELTEDRAALNLELLHKAERELAAEREAREGLEMRVASLESALREEIAWKELEQHKKEKAEAEMERIRADNRTIAEGAERALDEALRDLKHMWQERDAAIAVQREAEAQAAAMRAALQEHQRYWTDGFRWYCRYCGSEPVGIKESPVHKAACALSGTAGTALLARLERLEAALQTVVREQYHDQTCRRLTNGNWVCGDQCFTGIATKVLEEAQ